MYHIIKEYEYVAFFRATYGTTSNLYKGNGSFAGEYVAGQSKVGLYLLRKQFFLLSGYTQSYGERFIRLEERHPGLPVTILTFMRFYLLMIVLYLVTLIYTGVFLLLQTV
jgi:hypothetical protein